MRDLILFRFLKTSEFEEYLRGLEFKLKHISRPEDAIMVLVYNITNRLL